MSRLPRLGPRGEGWVVVQAVLLVAVLVAGQSAGNAWAGVAASLAWVVGAGLLAVAAFMVGRGFVDLGRNLTPLPRPRDGAQLVQTGIYGLVRHPLYGGLILGCLGYALLTASVVALLLACLVAVFFSLKSRREEAWLLEHFDGYAAYMTRTRRFIPWVY